MKKAAKPQPEETPVEESKKPRARKVLTGIALVATGIAGGAYTIVKRKSNSK